MAISMPAPIAKYFVADSERDAAAVADCFTADAVVQDEGRTYAGHGAIREWKAGSSAKYSYTVEPFAIANDGDLTVVTSHLVGDFPGSQVDLRYLFTLTDGGISTLEIML